MTVKPCLRVLIAIAIAIAVITPRPPRTIAAAS
jgi:hypothetical protein